MFAFGCFCLGKRGVWWGLILWVLGLLAITCIPWDWNFYLFCPFYYCIPPFFVLVCILILLLMSINLHGIGLPILILKVPCRWCMMLLESDFVLVSKLKWGYIFLAVCFGYILLAVLYMVYIALAINREKFSTFC